MLQSLAWPLSCIHIINVSVTVVVIQGMCLRTSLAQQATTRRDPQHCMPMTALTMLTVPLATRSCPASMGSCTLTPSGIAPLASFMSGAGISRYLHLWLHLFHASSALCCIPSHSFHACCCPILMPPLPALGCISFFLSHACSSSPCRFPAFHPGHALPGCRIVCCSVYAVMLITALCKLSRRMSCCIML